MADIHLSDTDGDRYRLLVDSVVDYAIYLLDVRGNIASWNKGAERFKGYTTDEVVGSHFSRFYTDEDRAADMPAVALQTADTEGKYEAEGWRVRKDGGRFWAHVVIDPVRSATGNLIGYAKVTRDLSASRLSKAEARRSEQQFRLLVQGVTDYAIYLLDINGHVTSWNLGAQRIKGYAPTEIIGHHFSRFYTPGDVEAGLPAKALATARQQGSYEREGWRLRKDGSRFWAHVVIDPVRDDDGNLIGFAKVTRDLTEKRAAQQELEKTRETLFQAQKSEAIGKLTGGIAHDFNNLLMVIQTSLELLRRRLPGEDTRSKELLENAIAGTRRGASLTQRMLAFARRQDLELKAVDLPELVRGMADLLQQSAGPGVTLETRFPPGLPLAVSDANQLELALMNLVVNARDAMQGAGQVVISARVDESGGDGDRPARFVCLAVTDTGEGMDEKTLAQATEPFFTTKGPGKGTGLGLPMVHGLAAQCGGRLLLQSEVGKGTTAELWLPVATEHHALSVAQAEPATPAAAATPRTVLVVDDDALVLQMAQAMLDDLGHRTHVASSAKEALAFLRGGSAVDVVISDHAMPEMTGSQLASICNREWPALPIIIATGYAELGEGDAGRWPRLRKPFGQALLRATIDKVLG